MSPRSGTADQPHAGRPRPAATEPLIGVAAAAAAVAAVTAVAPGGWLPAVTASLGALAAAAALLHLRRAAAGGARPAPGPGPGTLPTREEFTAAAQRMIDDGTGQPAVLVVEVDRFRDVETVLGADRAAAALAEVAERLAVVADGWPVGALGDERFAVAMMARPFLPAHHLARSLREAVSRPLVVDGVELRLASSVGLALGEGGAEALLRRAAIAVVAAATDPDGMETHRPEPPAVVRRRLQVASALTDAMDQPDRHAFRPEFQPIVDPTGRIVAAEALARWDDPAIGRIGPDEFVPLAEQTGQVNLLFGVVLGRALAGCATWQRAGLDATVSVNVSAINLRQPLLVAELTAALDAAGLTPQDVTLEVTETAVISDPVIANRTLAELRRVGFKVALDDFGVGHSSLARLRELPVTAVKLDKSFIAPLPGDRRSMSVVQATVHVCSTLDLGIVAEGVEREDQRELLAEMGVDRLQGFLFSASTDVEGLLQLHRDGARRAPAGDLPGGGA